jgi:hypothetical protein
MKMVNVNNVTINIILDLITNAAQLYHFARILVLMENALIAILDIP